MKPLLPLSLFGSWFASAGEIAVFIAIILTLIGIVVYSYIFIKHKQIKEHQLLMQHKYEKYLLNLSLTDEEREMITKMTGFLEHDHMKYYMLTNKRMFHQCAERLLKKEKYPRTLQDSIERKLDFPSRKSFGNYSSSEDLPPGMPALLLLGDKKKISASVSENGRSDLVLELKRDVPPLREGMGISVYFHDNQKIFIINTTVLEHVDNKVKVAHSPLSSQKRRAFKRKKIKLPILLKHSGFEEIPMHSYIIDLSEGGASVENPDFNFKKHEPVTLYYHLDTEDGFQIQGEVLRLSAKGRIMHIKFLERDLTLRSRIKTIVK